MRDSMTNGAGWRIATTTRSLSFSAEWKYGSWANTRVNGLRIRETQRNIKTLRKSVFFISQSPIDISRLGLYFLSAFLASIYRE
jgi:hypothetical protein